MERSGWIDDIIKDNDMIFVVLMSVPEKIEK
jgi:hypothetical protein